MLFSTIPLDFCALLLVAYANFQIMDNKLRVVAKKKICPPPILGCFSSDDHSQAYLTKFGDIQNMRVGNLKRPFIL